MCLSHDLQGVLDQKAINKRTLIDTFRSLNLARAYESQPITSSIRRRPGARNSNLMRFIEIPAQPCFPIGPIKHFDAKEGLKVRNTVQRKA
jgi:hypothetical protein